MDRSKQIIRTSILGIAVNMVLVLFKMTVGLLVHSIAIVLDAVNNLSDALSSVITIVGTRISEKKPDRQHPYGHGRVEYLASVAIAVLVLAAGLTSLKESAVKILHPEAASYTAASLIIVAVAVAVKFLMGRYVKKTGQRLHAQTLIASGSDAFFDAVLSLATLITALISLKWGLNLEGPLGALISLIILKAGVEMLLETVNTLIGLRADPELTEAIRRTICSFEGVSGAYDLTLHNYGPSRILGSVHIELPDAMTARQIHVLARAIAARIYEDFGVVLTVGVYAAGDSTPELQSMRRELTELASSRPEVLQVHGFLADPDSRCAMFDMIVDFSADAEALREALIREASARYPGWRFDIVLDTDISD